MITSAMIAAAAACVASGAAAELPVPTARQLEWMDLETIQFMHFSIPTSWKPPLDFLKRPNPTYHNCIASWIPDHGEQTGAEATPNAFCCLAGPSAAYSNYLLTLAETLSLPLAGPQ